MSLNKATLLYLLLLCGVCGACRQREEVPQTNAASTLPATKDDELMKAVIQQSTLYKNIPSASGIEVHKGLYYVIGDDSPFLYVLDAQFKQVNRLALTDTTGFSTGRISKDRKEDLESITKLELEGEAYLLLLGSGASAARQQAYLVSLLEPQAPVVQKYSLEKLYLKLQQDKRVVNEGLLNLEGVAAGNGKLYLLQRGLGTSNNVMIAFDLADFILYLKGAAAGALPSYSLSVFMLQQLEGFGAGFSGAYFFDDKLFFTASVESAPNAIDDGEVLGSFVGFISAEGLEAMAAEPETIAAVQITQSDGTAYKGKAESLMVMEKGAADNSYTMLVVTDDDQGHSELLKLQVELGEE